MTRQQRTYNVLYMTRQERASYDAPTTCFIWRVWNVRHLTRQRRAYNVLYMTRQERASYDAPTTRLERALFDARYLALERYHWAPILARHVSPKTRTEDCFRMEWSTNQCSSVIRFTCFGSSEVIFFVLVALPTKLNHNCRIREHLIFWTWCEAPRASGWDVLREAPWRANIRASVLGGGGGGGWRSRAPPPPIANPGSATDLDTHIPEIG